MYKPELLQRARTILSQLAQGYDPISGQDVPEDSVLQQLPISRCLSFAAEVLGEVEKNNGKVANKVKVKSLPFHITEEQLAQVELTEQTQIKDFTDRINKQVDDKSQGKLKVTAFGTWLAQKGYLEVKVVNEEKQKRCTQAGLSIGMSEEWRDYNGQGYYRILYSKDAQRFLLKHLNEIIAISNGD